MSETCRGRASRLLLRAEPVAPVLFAFLAIALSWDLLGPILAAAWRGDPIPIVLDYNAMMVGGRAAKDGVLAQAYSYDWMKVTDATLGLPVGKWLPFTNPPIAALVFAPLALVSTPTGFLAFEATGLCLFAAAVMKVSPSGSRTVLVLAAVPVGRRAPCRSIEGGPRRGPSREAFLVVLIGHRRADPARRDLDVDQAWSNRRRPEAARRRSSSALGWVVAAAGRGVGIRLVEPSSRRMARAGHGPARRRIDRPVDRTPSCLSRRVTADLHHRRSRLPGAPVVRHFAVEAQPSRGERVMVASTAVGAGPDRAPRDGHGEAASPPQAHEQLAYDPRSGGAYRDAVSCPQK